MRNEKREHTRARATAGLRNANNIPISAATLVRDGFTNAERIAIANRDPRVMAGLDNFDAATRTEICRLCDAYKRKHGGR